MIAGNRSRESMKSMRMKREYVYRYCRTERVETKIDLEVEGNEGGHGRDDDDDEYDAGRVYGRYA